MGYDRGRNLMSGFCAMMVGSGTVPLDTQTITSGLSGSAPDRIRGYDSSPALGSISDGTSNLYSGATVLELYHDESVDSVIFKVNGVVANSGWTTLNITGGTGAILARSAASFSTAGSVSTWTWTGVGGNPTGGNGTVITATFT